MLAAVQGLILAGAQVWCNQLNTLPRQAVMQVEAVVAAIRDDAHDSGIPNPHLPLPDFDRRLGLDLLVFLLGEPCEEVEAC